MNTHTRLFSVISYITWIGWIIAFVFRDKNDKITLQHVNQALALNIVGILVSLGSRLGGVSPAPGVFQRDSIVSEQPDEVRQGEQTTHGDCRVEGGIAP